MINGWKPLAIFAKSPVLNVWWGSENAFVDSEYIPA